MSLCRERRVHSLAWHTFKHKRALGKRAGGKSVRGTVVDSAVNAIMPLNIMCRATTKSTG
jgi:hypothetical protein